MRWDEHVEKAFLLPSAARMQRIAAMMKPQEMQVSVKSPTDKVISATYIITSLMLMGLQDKASSGGISQKRWSMVFGPQKVILKMRPVCTQELVTAIAMTMLSKATHVRWVHNSTVAKRETDGHIVVIGHGGEENHLCPQGPREEEELGHAASI